MSEKKKKSEKARSALLHLMKKMNLDSGSDFIMAGMVMEYIETTGLEPETSSASVDEITKNFTNSLELLEDERNDFEQRYNRVAGEVSGLKASLGRAKKTIVELEEKLDNKIEDEFNGTFTSDDIVIEEFVVE